MDHMKRAIPVKLQNRMRIKLKTRSQLNLIAQKFESEKNKYHKIVPFFFCTCISQMALLSPLCIPLKIAAPREEMY